MAEDYTYMVARLRAIEATMPDKSWFQRLARTSEDGLLGSLREYYGGFEAVGSLCAFEEGIEKGKVADINLVSGLIEDSGTRMFIRAGYDFDNILHMWKARVLGAQPSLTPFGQVEPGLIERAVEGNDPGSLPPHLKLFLERIEVEGSSKKLAEVECLGEAAKWNFLLGIAPGRGARAITRHRIDLINIKNLVRLKRTALRTGVLDMVWIEGGEIEAVRLKVILKGPEEELYSFLETTTYRGLLGLGLEKQIPLWKIDPILRLQLLGIMGESRYSFFDLSPVLYHLELRERDEQLLRTIIVGKLNRLPEEKILERVDAILPS